MPEFRSSEVGGRSLTLPARSLVRFRFGMALGSAAKEAEYRSYRLASSGADSDIRFRDPVDEWP
jgi:hypothetical protein